VTARAVQGVAPYPGQAHCLALGFWPECFRRLNVKGGRRSFPKETRSALDIEGKHVTIQGPSRTLSPADVILHLQAQGTYGRVISPPLVVQEQDALIEVLARGELHLR
jgi:hypothetical protein